MVRRDAVSHARRVPGAARRDSGRFRLRPMEWAGRAEELLRAARAVGFRERPVDSIQSQPSESRSGEYAGAALRRHCLPLKRRALPRKARMKIAPTVTPIAGGL